MNLTALQACLDGQRHYQRTSEMWRMGGHWPYVMVSDVIAEAYVMRADTLTKLNSDK